MSSCVPCLCWVAKGVAKEVPDKVQLSREEVQHLLQGAQDHLEELGLSDSSKVEGDDETAGVKVGDSDRGEDGDIEALYDMDNYDENEEGGDQVSGAGMGNSFAGLSYFASNDDDPYVTLKNMDPNDDDEDDYRVLPTDNMLVIGRAEEDFSSMEIHIYNKSADHVYSHHEILLTSFPLALEWMDFDPEQPDKKGNYIAVATMTRVIEVWDLDMVDGLEPVFILGDPAHLIATHLFKQKAGKNKKKSKKTMASEVVDGHTDSVLGLSWNRLVRNILASASADKTVRVWDMTWPKCVLTLKHKDKVQCVLWHPYTPELLATGGYDKTVRVYNCKLSEMPVGSWDVEGEVERLLWNHLKPEQLLASTDTKTIWCFDKDSGAVLFRIDAHTASITAITLSCYVPGLLATASSDDTVKFWDIDDNKPVFLFSRDMHMGSIHCAQFCVDSPYALAVGGEKNGFHVIDAGRLLAVTQRFKKRGFIVPTISPAETQPTEDRLQSADEAMDTENKMEDQETGQSLSSTSDLSNPPLETSEQVASITNSPTLTKPVKTKKVVNVKKLKSKRKH